MPECRLDATVGSLVFPVCCPATVPGGHASVSHLWSPSKWLGYPPQSILSGTITFRHVNCSHSCLFHLHIFFGYLPSFHCEFFGILKYFKSQKHLCTVWKYFPYLVWVIEVKSLYGFSNWKQQTRALLSRLGIPLSTRGFFPLIFLVSLLRKLSVLHWKYLHIKAFKVLIKPDRSDEPKYDLSEIKKND